MACAGCGGQAKAPGTCRVVSVPLGKGQLDLVLSGPVTAADLDALEEYVNFAGHVFRRVLAATPAEPAS
jgi:hypothetical protein